MLSSPTPTPTIHHLLFFIATFSLTSDSIKHKGRGPQERLNKACTGSGLIFVNVNTLYFKIERYCFNGNLAIFDDEIRD